MKPASLNEDSSLAIPKRSNRPRSDGHVAAASAGIVMLSTGLSAGFGVLGILGRTDRLVSAWVTVPKGPNSPSGVDFANQLPSWAVWGAVILISIFVSVSILTTPGWERRLLLWFSTLLLIATWAPVLSLAAYFPEISAVFAASTWAGLCACVYAANHRMPCDHPKSSSFS